MKDNRNILLFSVSRLLSELGTSVFRFALSLYILDITGSASMFALVLSFTYIPTVLVNVFAGVLIDRSNKKKILVLCDFLSGASIFLFLGVFQFYPESILLFIGYGLVLSTIQSFFSLTVSASVPNLVSEEKVPAINSSNQSISALINIVGPIIGAMAYSMFGLENIFWVEGVTFTLSAVLNLFLVFNVTKVQQEETKPYFESLKEVYSYISGHKAIKGLLAIFVLTNFVIAPSVSLVLPYLIYQVHSMSPEQLSYIEASLGAGIIVGALVVSMKKVNQFVSNKIFILIQMQALTVVLWAFPELLSLDTEWKIGLTAGYMLLLALTGVFNAMGNIPMVSYVQMNIPEHIRASIFGVVGTVTTLSVPIGMWIYGLALEAVHWSYLTVGSGLLLIIVGAVAHRNQNLREFFKMDMKSKRG